MANFSDPPTFAAPLAAVQAALEVCAHGVAWSDATPQWARELYEPTMRCAIAHETHASQVLRRWRERNGL